MGMAQTEGWGVSRPHALHQKVLKKIKFSAPFGKYHVLQLIKDCMDLKNQHKHPLELIVLMDHYWPDLASISCRCTIAAVFQPF